MADLERTFTEREAHKYFGVSFNNLVWTLLGKKERTDEDTKTMVHAAHASHYHWTFVGGPEHRARGEWLVSRVYSVLHCPESAIHHALASLDLCTDNAIGGFDIAYAYEACARAYASSGDLTQCRDYYAKALDAGSKIEDREERELFESDLKTEPWFGALETSA